MNENECTNACIMRGINNVITNLNTIICNMNSMSCGLDNNMAEIINNQRTIISQLAYNNPMTILGQYPEELDDKVVYFTQRIIPIGNGPSNLVLSDMYNPNIYMLFKQPLNIDKPSYLQDGSGFQHVISLTDGGEPISSQDLENNVLYKSLYKGNFIILNYES